MSAESTLIYLYGIVPDDAPDPPPELVGLDDRPVHLLRAHGIAAIVSGVPAQAYGDDALNARLDDLGWVGARGLAHERVLDWFVEQSTVLPLSLFSLHRDVERIERRLAAEADTFVRLLDRLRGRKEWGIKLWRVDAEAVEGIDQLSPSLTHLNAEIKAAPEGKRFLLVRKREAMRKEEIRSASKRIAHELFGALRNAADAGTSVPLPSNVPSGDRSLLLHAAYLVADARFDTFQKVVNEQAGNLAGSGFQLEFTGPWPPYHFAQEEDDDD